MNGGGWRAAALAALCGLGCNAVATSSTAPGATDVPAGGSCVTGTVAACACADGSRGRQLCGLDMVYGPCACGATDAGAPVDAGAGPADAGPPTAPVPGPACTSSGAVDLVVMVDNSNSMRDNQATLARGFGTVVGTLLAPAGGGHLRSLHVGVLSSDLGTPGSAVPSCANSDVGDDGAFNPIRNGAALGAHQPWTTANPGVRPPRCESRPDQYPGFLEFAASTSDTQAFSQDFVCNAYLSIGGCGLEQQLESVYRALVVRNPRAEAGNADVNAGFLRDDSVLAILVLTDEEDGSARDCRYAETGDPDGVCRSGGRGSAITVFDSTNDSWASADLNLRMYMYTPGSPQDPTWPIARYVDPRRGNRGFFATRPGRANLVVFGALTGVPLDLARGETVDWDAMLGRNPDGSDGYAESSDEGPVSMRQANGDPNCPTRVVPGCRRGGTTYRPGTCDTTQQYFAWPGRRIAEVVRRVHEVNGNGVLGSICATNYTDFLQRFASRIASRLCGT